MQDKKVVIVALISGVIVKGIEKLLRGKGYEVSVIDKDFDAVKQCDASSNLFVLYLPKEINESAPEYAALKGIGEMIADGGKAVLIGDKGGQAGFVSLVPAFNGQAWIDRPVNMESLVSSVKNGIAELGQGALKRILIVDDDPSYAKMVREWIKDYYRVDILTTGTMAAKFLTKNKIDLVLLDYEMPTMDGPAVLSEIRADETLKDITVVFLTGLTTPEGISRILELNPEGYIMKSITKENLISSINEHIH